MLIFGDWWFVIEGCGIHFLKKSDSVLSWNGEFQYYSSIILRECLYGQCMPRTLETCFVP